MVRKSEGYYLKLGKAKEYFCKVVASFKIFGT